MQDFELEQPRTLDEALELLDADQDARPFSGGTALVVLMKLGILGPLRLVSLRRIPELAGIWWHDQGGLRIGAMARIHEVERHPIVQSKYPALAAACKSVANIRIRNLATAGGNLAHADSQSDPPPMMLALNARVHIRSRNGGDREEPLDTFLRSTYETSLQPGELVSEVIVPPPPASSLSRYVKFTTRSSEDRPCVSIAAVVEAERGVCSRLSLVIGAVSPAPVRATEAEQLASGQPLGVRLAGQIAEAAAAVLRPATDIRGSGGYKRHVAKVLTRRVVEDLAREERER